MFTTLIVIVILVFINGFFAASEMALVSISPSDLHRIKTEGKKNAELLESVTNDSTQYLSTIQVAITFAGFLSSAFAGSRLSGYVGSFLNDMGISLSNSVLVIIITILLSFFTLVFGELVPKRIALSRSEGFALFSAPIINVVMKIFKPFVALLTVSTRGVLKLIGIKPQSEDETITEKDIKEMIVYGHIKGLYKSEEKDMLHRIFRYDDLTAGYIMTPLQDVVGLDIHHLSKKIIQTMVDSKYSRIPVYESSIENIKGVLLAKDILSNLGDNTIFDVDLRKVMREPILVHEDLKINKLLQQMKETKRHLVFVVNDEDEYKGIVTMEDIVEEIVGNIYDEHDDIQNVDETHSKFIYVVEGNTPMQEVNEILEISISYTETVVTIEDYIKMDLNYDGNDSLLSFDYGEMEVLSKEKDTITQVRIILDENKIDN